MLIRSPPSLHYPITVKELLAKPDTAVDRFAPLFSYTYTSTVTESDKYGDEKQVQKIFPADFQSELDGTLVAWKISTGQVLERAGISLVDIEEPCKHEIQFGGLCTNCGQDMTLVDFMTTQRNADRATVTMSHENTALKVSQSEAARASEEAKHRLLESRKLSLVVDLDQTIIHATVDPTVADWQSDPANPNYEAVKNVRSFQLIDEGPGGRGCWYYIKLRPCLEEFLEQISKKYELHIYTMGTRAYAQNIAKLVDPQQKIFGDRILSRDESGSMVVKNLQRLFPIDTDMVVVIDDRGDVWKWSENLIKVTPYDFFVGIGDINSSFLPKRAELVSKRKSPPPSLPTKLVINTSKDADGSGMAEAAAVEEATAEETMKDEVIALKIAEEPVATVTDLASLGTQLVEMSGGDDPSLMAEQNSAQAEAIAVQLEDRPLLKMQELLDKRDEEEEIKSQSGEDGGDTASVHEHEHKPRHNLLHDDDEELEYLQKHLEAVHSTFFDDYDNKLKGAANGRVSQLRGEKSPKKPRVVGEDALIVPDVKEIMPQMKSRVLEGVVICFTGVIPQGVKHEISDIGMWTRSFGAQISSDISRATTHVVAHKDRRTSKVRLAAKFPSIQIVTVNWLLQCFTRWAHVEESPHLIEIEREDHGDSFSVPNGEENLLTPSEDGEGEPIPDDLMIEPISPTLGKADWDDVNAELDEFLDSGDDDTDFDSEMDDGMDSDASTRSASSVQSTSSRSKKRKRAAESVDGSGGENSDDSSSGPLGSELQKRKKRALERTTGLANVATVDTPSGLPSPETTGPEEETGDRIDRQPANGNHQDGDDGDEFERQMLAEFERQSNEPDDDEEH